MIGQERNVRAFGEAVVARVINEDIPAKVAADKACQNAQKNSDRQNARIEHDNGLLRVMHDLLADHTELYKQFSDNDSFRKWLADMLFSVTTRKEATVKLLIESLVWRARTVTEARSASEGSPSLVLCA